MSPPTNLHALLIGVDCYEDTTIQPLDAARNDVTNLHDTLVDPHGCGYPRANVRSVMGPQTSKDGLFAELERLSDACKPDDTVIVYFSGHGMALQNEGTRCGYLLPYDGRGDIKNVENTWIPFRTFLSACDSFIANHVVVILDCCYAGSAELLSQVLTKYDTPRGRVLFASSPANERAYTNPVSGMSRFTSHLVEGLRGAAPGKDGAIRVFDLFEYVERSMKNIPGLEKVQRPIFKAEVGENFPIALWRGGNADDRNESPFDAYISFAEQDGDWVYDVLLPALEQEGLKICTSDLEATMAGGYRVASVERAIEQSRRIVLILSSHHAESSWAHYETMLGRTRAIEDRKPRLVPFLRESMKLQALALRSLQPIDYTHPRFGGAEAIRRLCQALRSPIR